MKTMNPILIASNISKTFGVTDALSDVSFVIHSGERVAIVGENGAGKSTLMKIFAGVFTPDSGSIHLHGRIFSPRNPLGAIEAGISTVYQEPFYFPHLSVEENLLMGRQATKRFGVLEHEKIRSDSRKLLDQVSLPINMLDKKMRSLSLAEQQLVLIARAIAQKASVLILDEPTSILTDTEASRLFEHVNLLASQGTAICYITHRFDELSQIADRIFILRDGKNVGDLDKPDKSKILDLMGSYKEGRQSLKSGSLFKINQEKKEQHTQPKIKISKLCSKKAFRDISLEIHPGEIFGIYGLVGSGRTELAQAIFGTEDYISGTIEYKGKAYQPTSSLRSIKDGIAYLPEDRKTLGIFQFTSVKENISISILPRLKILNFIRKKEENRVCLQWLSDISIKADGINAGITSLSGGNQQKTMLARMLATSPEFLMLDEPTRGIDVGTKKEIHRRIKELAHHGVAILVISSEMSELLELSDSISIMREGFITKRFDKNEYDEKSILAEATGIV
jgi:ABC-type sugar transport system ATPase subunit